MTNFSLSRIRNQKGLSQIEFASMLGISDSLLSKFEIEPLNVPVRILIQISDIFGIPVNELFFSDDESTFNFDFIEDVKSFSSFNEIKLEKLNFLSRKLNENLNTDEKTATAVKKIFEKIESKIHEIYRLPKIAFIGNSIIDKKSCISILKNCGIEKVAQIIESDDFDNLIDCDAVFIFTDKMNSDLVNDILENPCVRKNDFLTNVFIFNGVSDSVKLDSESFLMNDIVARQNISADLVKSRFFFLSKRKEFLTSLSDFLSSYFSDDRFDVLAESINLEFSNIENTVDWASTDVSKIFIDINRCSSKIDNIIEDFEISLKNSIIENFNLVTDVEKVYENDEIKNLVRNDENSEIYPYKNTHLQTITLILLQDFRDKCVYSIQQSEAELQKRIEALKHEFKKNFYINSILSRKFCDDSKSLVRDAAIYQFRKSVRKLFFKQIENVNTFSRGKTRSKLRKISTNIQKLDSQEINNSLRFYFDFFKNRYSLGEILELSFICADSSYLASIINDILLAFPVKKSNEISTNISNTIIPLSEKELVRKTLEILSKNPNRAEFVQVNWNLVMDTMGGKIHWDTIAEFDGWRFQQNIHFGNCRILNPDDRRFAWGSKDKFLEKFKLFVSMFGDKSI